MLLIRMFAYDLNLYYTISYVEFLRKFLLHYAGRKFYFETTEMAWYVSDKNNKEIFLDECYQRILELVINWWLKTLRR